MKRWTVAVALLCVASLVGCSSSKESLVKKGQHRSSSGPHRQPLPPSPKALKT
jgi:hypothetical protein